MHVLRMFTYPDGRQVWRVGYFDPLETRQRWMVLKEFDNEVDAAAYVSYLNGGAEPKKPG